MKKNEESLLDLWNTIKTNNFWIIGVPGGKERTRMKGAENLLKVTMAENFPNLRRDLDIQVYEANKSAQNFNPKGSFSRIH